jgi:hypothetical protein
VCSSTSPSSLVRPWCIFGECLRRLGHPWGALASMPWIPIVITAFIMALTFVLLFEYGRPLFRRLRRITALVMAEQKSIATQTEETPGVSSADRFVQTTTAYQTIKASSDNDGHVPFVFPPALPMVVPVVPMNMSQRSESQGSGDGHVPLAGSPPPPPAPAAYYPARFGSGLPLVYLAPKLCDGFKYHPRKDCRTISHAQPLMVARCKICG